MIDRCLEAIHKILAAFRGHRWDQEIEAELHSHLQLATEENIRRGMSEEEARTHARIQIGGWEQAKEEHRDARGLPVLESVVQDLGYALRTLKRDAGYAMFAILIVGLGIGASSTVFSVFNTLLVRPLPFKDPQGLVWIANRTKVDGDLSGATLQVTKWTKRWGQVRYNGCGRLSSVIRLRDDLCARDSG